jgi:hypothetical protein
MKARTFGVKEGCGRDGWAKAWPEMGAGKEVRSMGGTASTLFDLGCCQRCASGEFGRIVVFSVLIEYVIVRVG